jgi:ribosome biogenesis GTPase A
MVAARKKAAETMATIDVVVEVVDARLPEASTNPMVRELRRRRQRPCLKVLNKADLADPETTKSWIAWYSLQPGVRAVAIDARRPGEAARVPALCQGLAPHRDDNTKPLRMMIMGIPNVGKSTLMNALVRRKIARVGDEPAVTKSQQLHRLDIRHWLVDTPGLMWPKIEYDSDGYMLAASHAVGRNAVADEEVAVFLADCLLAHYPARLLARYGFSVEGLDGVAILEGIARCRGLLGRRGAFNLEKASLVLLQDYRDGKLGRVSLETPDSRDAMLASHRDAVENAGIHSSS